MPKTTEPRPVARPEFRVDTVVYGVLIALAAVASIVGATVAVLAFIKG